jgi:hypothetical protein
MVRIAKAIAHHVPPHVKVVDTRDKADLCVLYVIGLDAVAFAAHLKSLGKKYIVVQCCLHPAIADKYQSWFPLWKGASVVWSYYDLHTLASDVGFRFLHSPLGVDPPFLSAPSDDAHGPREPLVITSGLVSGEGAEAIEEVWRAAAIINHRVVHLGPPGIVGISSTDYPHVTFQQPNDSVLAALYSRARWVAALRHVEGFELPAAEGLVCGARPVVFDQPAMRHWYGPLATYVPDTHGEPLVSKLVSALSAYRPVADHDRYRARARFNWSDICASLWEQVELSKLDGTGPPPVVGGYRRARTSDFNLSPLEDSPSDDPSIPTSLPIEESFS